MSRRSPVLSLAGISVVLLATTAFTTPATSAAARASRTTPPARATAAAVGALPGAPKTAAPTARKALVEEAVNIDWRVLAGLDYTNGKSTDTLKKLEGKLVRIPGFVVPLDDFQEEGAEFLLVPYYGACVHTPPPPPNQIVMVEMGGKKAIKLNLFDAVWMSGRLKIASVESPYGTVGYQLEGLKVEPYSSK